MSSLLLTKSSHCKFFQRFSGELPLITPRTCKLLLFPLRNCESFRANECHYRQRMCSINGNAEAYKLTDADNTAPDDQGLTKEDEAPQGQSMTAKEILKKLKRYGVSGILSYGLLNTAYYLTTFLLVWYYFAPSPGRMGYLAAVERFVKVMAMVWAGSQVTKLIRAAGALALSPFVDTGLSWFTVKFNFESKGKAFLAIVGSCFGLAIMLFIVVTLLSA